MGMSTNDQVTAPARGPGSFLIFAIINILLFPLSLVGYVLWIGQGYLGGLAPGVSMTAQGPLFSRFIEHRLGTRPDRAANRLMLALPGVSHVAIWLSAKPLLFASRVSGYVPRAFRYPYEGDVPEQYEAAARQSFFDEVVAREIPGIDQLVILGAGFDTRAFRIPRNIGVRSFEVDAPETQAVKISSLKKAGIDAARVSFVAADFQKDDWLKRLVEAGYNPGKKSLFIWEGVTLYLNREAVEDTFRKIARTARGSVVAFDYFTTEPLESQSLYWRYGRLMTKAAGEPITFGFDSTPPSRERVAGVLRSCGLTLGEQRTLGQETAGKRAWGGFATAVVP
jgi:methyltransferase (TIGR00027 family)